MTITPEIILELIKLFFKHNQEGKLEKIADPMGYDDKQAKLEERIRILEKQLVELKSKYLQLEARVLGLGGVALP